MSKYDTLGIYFSDHDLRRAMRSPFSRRSLRMKAYGLLVARNAIHNRKRR
jgi:hypothetical protein